MVQVVRLRELSQPREVRPALLRNLGERRHRHQPHDLDGAGLEVAGELVRWDARLLALLGDVDLEQDLRVGRTVLGELLERGPGRDRVDQLHVREDLLDLARLQLADEVPADLGVLAALGLEVLRAVLAEQVHARLAQRVELVDRHVLDRGEDLDLGRGPARLRDPLLDALEVRADLGGLEAGDQARHTTPAWRPVMPLSRRWLKKRSSQIVQIPASSTSATPASCSRATCARSRLRPLRASWAANWAWTSSPTS